MSWKRRRRLAARSVNGATELFGLCGAGKSSVAGMLLAEDGPSERMGFRAETPVKSSGSVSAWTSALVVVHYFFRDPLGCSRLLGSASGRWLLGKLGYRIAGLRKRGDLEGSLLVDSGVLQPLISFEVEYNIRSIPWDLESLVRTLPLPSAALYVEVEPDVAMQRYLDREEQKGRSVHREGIEERFARGHKTANKLYDVCSSYGVRCIIHNNESDLSEKAIDKLRYNLQSKGDIK